MRDKCQTVLNGCGRDEQIEDGRLIAGVQLCRSEDCEAAGDGLIDIKDGDVEQEVFNRAETVSCGPLTMPPTSEVLPA